MLNVLVDDLRGGAEGEVGVGEGAHPVQPACTAFNTITEVMETTPIRAQPARQPTKQRTRSISKDTSKNTSFKLCAILQLQASSRSLPVAAT